jgi:ABC-type uncharacterized transport system YnjBCD permease subunit
MMPASTAKWDDLSIESPLDSSLDSSQLDQISLELELVTIAIAALTRIDRLEIEQIAQELQVESTIDHWFNEWPDCQHSSPKQIDLAQIRSRISILHHLAQKYQMVVRQNMNYWQQIVQFNRLPLESPALAEYISNFINICQARLDRQQTHSTDELSQAALNLLIELLFYSSSNGHRRLWNALLHRSHATATPPKPT